MRCFYCSQIAQAKQMPRKHLWLSIPSVILDMLHICWEGRTVNQTIIAWRPSVKAKGQKVPEKSNLCYNSPSVMYTSLPFFACVSVCKRHCCQRHTFMSIYWQIHMLLYIPSHILGLGHPPILHHFFNNDLPLERAITLHWCEAGVGQRCSEPLLAFLNCVRLSAASRCLSS